MALMLPMDSGWRVQIAGPTWEGSMETDTLIAFVAGFLAGGFGGILLISLMLMAGRNNDDND